MKIELDASKAVQPRALLAHRCEPQEQLLVTDEGFRVALTSITIHIPLQAGGRCPVTAEGYLADVGGSIQTEMDMGELTLSDPQTGKQFHLEPIQ